MLKVGDRLPELTTPGLLRVGAVLLLTSPFTPMLWMGEEWAASTRWPFFTSHPEPELARLTSEGRIAEFGDHGWDVAQMDRETGSVTAPAAAPAASAPVAATAPAQGKGAGESAEQQPVVAQK